MVAPTRGALNYPGCLDFIDVSACQGQSIDWPLVKAAGFMAVVVKVTEGSRGIDKDALRNLEGADAAGLYTMIYDFARIEEDADAQAQLLWDASGPIVRCPIVDFESAPDHLDPLTLARRGLALADAIEQRFGRPPWLYSGENFFLNRIGSAFHGNRELADAFARMPSWIAAYGSVTVPTVPLPGKRPRVPAWQPPCVAWQYSGNNGYRVPGISVDCDRNLFFGDEARFRSLLGLPPADFQPDMGGIVHPSIFRDPE